MSWDLFVWFAAAAALCWIVGAVLAFVSKRTWPAAAVSLLGSVVLIVFVVGMWVTLKRPPMRTMGETRLWYSLFLSLIGVVIYLSWRYKWILSFSTMMSMVFLAVNVFKPQIHNQPLMPALQSPWFVPHVIVYMFAYALLGAVTLYAIWLWIRMSRLAGARRQDPTSGDMKRCDVLVRIGWSFLTFGIVMGALWAKEAWGDWWSWDPKETWALATWLGYMAYLHMRRGPAGVIYDADPSGDTLSESCPAGGSLAFTEVSRRNARLAFIALLICFLLLQMCWYGVNYLPSARGISVHTY